MVVANTTNANNANDAQTLPQGIKVNNPVTGAVIGTILVSTSADVQSVIDRARAAHPAWSAMTITERGKFIRKFGDLLWKNRQKMMQIIRDETGKNETGAYIEVLYVDNVINYYLHHAPQILAPQKRPTIFPIIQRAKVFRKPFGVVGVITSWNYPMMLGAMDLIAALLAGNTVVVKPSEIAPFSLMYTVDLLRQAGVPDNVVQVVNGTGETGKAMIDEVDYISFVGSTEVGRKVAQQAGERLIPSSLELGGKDSAIVLRDAKIDVAAANVLTGALENAGQSCIGIERVYVESPIYDEFVAHIQQLTEKLRLDTAKGFNVHMGSLTNEREVERTEAHIGDALNKGAQLLYGGKRRPELGPLFFEPTLLVKVDHSMAVMQEETFGPIVPIMRVSNSDEAIRLTNASQYGLSATIYTTDLDRGERLALQLQTGDVSINRHGSVSASAALPWGGQKDSGYGRRNGPEGLLRFTWSQSVLIDTQIGQQATPRILDNSILSLLKVMRVIRRYLPFV